MHYASIWACYWKNFSIPSFPSSTFSTPLRIIFLHLLLSFLPVPSPLNENRSLSAALLRPRLLFLLLRRHPCRCRKHAFFASLLFWSTNSFLLSLLLNSSFHRKSTRCHPPHSTTAITACQLADIPTKCYCIGGCLCAALPLSLTVPRWFPLHCPSLLCFHAINICRDQLFSEHPHTLSHNSAVQERGAGQAKSSHFTLLLEQ